MTRLFGDDFLSAALDDVVMSIDRKDVLAAAGRLRCHLE